MLAANVSVCEMCVRVPQWPARERERDSDPNPVAKPVGDARNGSRLNRDGVGFSRGDGSALSRAMRPMKAAHDVEEVVAVSSET